MFRRFTLSVLAAAVLLAPAAAFASPATAAVTPARSPALGETWQQALAAARAAASASVARPGAYTVRPGESLSVAAARVYGTPAAWTVLYWANHGKIRWADQVRAGLRLTVPPLPARLPAPPRLLRPAPPRIIHVTTVAETRPQSSPQPAPAAQGSLQAYAASIAGPGQFGCVDAIFTRESGWDPQAENPDGAYGIPQALPGSKMASAGPDWATNPYTQIRWGIGYMNATYGSPCAAWSHWQAAGWY